MHVTNLEPNILLIQRPWRIVDDILETLHIIESALYHQKRIDNLAYRQALLELLLLFVDYAKPEIDFVCLLKVWLHSHNL